MIALAESSVAPYSESGDRFVRQVGVGVYQSPINKVTILIKRAKLYKDGLIFNGLCTVENTLAEDDSPHLISDEAVVAMQVTHTYTYKLV